MGFDHGNLSFRVCALPEELPEDFLERLDNNHACELVHVKDEPEWGWVSGRFLLENQINESTCKIGPFYHICLRQAERRIPGALLNAQCRLEELSRMAADHVDHLNRKVLKEIKAEVRERLLPDMPPTLSGIYCAIDPFTKLLYTTASSAKQMDIFCGFFAKAVGFAPIPLTPEDLALTQFTIDPENVPAVNISPNLADANGATGLLGENFLTWLWYFQEEHQGVIPPTKLGNFGIMIEGPLTFVAEGSGSFESSLRKGTPTLSAEARAAMMVGKKLRSAKITLGRDKGEEWTCTLDASQFIFKGLHLPDGDSMDPVDIFSDRMANLEIFRQVIFELFHLYLTTVSDPQKRADYQKKAQKWVEEHEQN